MTSRIPTPLLILALLGVLPVGATDAPWRLQLRERLARIMGPLPVGKESAPLDVQTESVEDLGDFERRRIFRLHHAGWQWRAQK